MESYSKLDTTVRKGAWTREEDERLKQCVQSHGEGKWHLVPYKAGLSRCRKSCRLRWLNYLKPNIKRGDFSEDEVDLIIRLHKLLGNRWSMIAGRLPGRTANDVKNYWNTRLRTNSHFRKKKDVSGQQTAKTVVIRPQPRSFVKISSSVKGKEPVSNHIQTSEQSMSTLSETSAECGNNWWETFLDDKADDAFPCVELEEEMLASFWFDEMSQSTASTSCRTFIDEGLSKSDHFPFNAEFWNHSNEEIK